MKIPRKNRHLGVVASVEQQTAQAAALAQISGQRRLADPRTNPAVRTHADTLRDEQHRRALDAEHTRLLRRHRVEDRRAEEAERTLEAIGLARRASSPARSVLALHNGKRCYLRLSLAASLVLATGSAMGVEATAEALHAPMGSGYIAEMGLTGLATAAITYRAHLAEHRGKLANGSWQSRLLWVLMTAPLLLSVACNLGMVNVVGAFCAIGAAAFSLLSCIVADRSAAAMQARADEVTETDTAELLDIAAGGDLFTAVETEPDTPTDAEHETEDLAEAFAEPTSPPELFPDDALAAWLNEPPDDGVPSSRPDPDSDGPSGAAHTPPGRPENPSIRPGQISSDQSGREQAPGKGDRVKAANARHAAAARNRTKIAAYMAGHPGATIEQIATATGLSTKTVQRHRTAIQKETEG